MWDTVLLLAVAAGLGPTRIATVVLLVSRAEPIPHLLTYLATGIGVTIAIGAAILFVIGYTGIGQSNALFAWLEIAAGVLGLLFAAAIGSGLAARVHAWWRSRQPDSTKNARSESDGARSLLSRVPGFDRMPRRLRAKLDGESPWFAGVAGTAFGLPTFYLLATIAAILEAGMGLQLQVAALVVFSVVAFMQGVIPLLGFLVAPEATRSGLDRFYSWLKTRQQLVVAALAAISGSYLTIRGISAL